MKIIRRMYRKFEEKRLVRCADAFLRERYLNFKNNINKNKDIIDTNKDR